MLPYEKDAGAISRPLDIFPDFFFFFLVILPSIGWNPEFELLLDFS